MLDPTVRRALISVSDKAGLVDFARGLVACGVELLSTGGTRKHLEAAGIPVRDVAAYTGFPEMLDGRIKTLHPKLHGGILCRHDVPADLAALAEHGISTIELVVVNLYPFAATIARPDVADHEAIEQIDIGGPSMVRAAAKNHAFVAIVTDPGQYAAVLAEVQTAGATSFQTRRGLAGAAFAHTAAYDATIAAYFAGGTAAALAAAGAGNATAAGPADDFPATLAPRFAHVQALRYGENPHQRAALYAEAPAGGPATGDRGVVGARQLHGKELSYNNFLDLDSAWSIVRGLDAPAAVVIKHNNPCGAAVAATLAEAVQRGLDGDPLSAFGSVLGLNRTLDLATAEVLCTPGLFVEAIVAVDFEPAALAALATRPKWHANVRLLLAAGPARRGAPRWEQRPLVGGLLVQDADVGLDPEDQWTCVTQRRPEPAEWLDLRFAWELVRHVKSNAIVIAKDGMLLGAGAGQMSRVDSTHIAVSKAGARARGAALASDAFFPFPDSIEAAAAAGVAAVIQPGGSKNDAAAVAACDRLGLAMLCTGRRHFRH